MPALKSVVRPWTFRTENASETLTAGYKHLPVGAKEAAARAIAVARAESDALFARRVKEDSQATGREAVQQREVLVVDEGSGYGTADAALKQLGAMMEHNEEDEQRRGRAQIGGNGMYLSDPGDDEDDGVTDGQPEEQRATSETDHPSPSSNSQQTGDKRCGPSDLESESAILPHPKRMRRDVAVRTMTL